MTSTSPSNLPPIDQSTLELFRKLSDSWNTVGSFVDPTLPLQDIDERVRPHLATIKEKGVEFAKCASAYSALAERPDMSEVRELRDNLDAQCRYIARTISHLRHLPGELYGWVWHQANDIHASNASNDLMALSGNVSDWSERAVRQLERTFKR